jgi:predicted  nucleic acid-binding Zn-ribbon protein
MTSEAEEIIRFLRRFSDLMSNGYNADHLSRAAALVGTLVDRVSNTEELLRAEKSARTGVEIEVAKLNASLADQQLKLSEAITNAAMEEQKLLERAEQAETRLASIESDLAEGLVSDTHVIVPISTLRLAESQFEALTTEVSDFVARVMCAVGASTLNSVIRRSAVQEGKVQ